jgi:hypothetical protein
VLTALGFLEAPGERESRLVSRLLGLAAQATGEGQLVASPQLLRLSQARAHLCACEIFVHEIHLSAPVLVGGHGVVSGPSVKRCHAGGGLGWSDGASEGETGLLRCLLGLPAESACHGQLVAAAELLRLSQARGHLGPRQGFVHGVHLGTPVRVGRHVWWWISSLM